MINYPAKTGVLNIYVSTTGPLFLIQYLEPFLCAGIDPDIKLCLYCSNI